MWDGIICDPVNNKVTSIRIQSADLYATIPSELGKLTSLETLVLRENLLYGSIPTEVASLPNLQTFDVAENDLRGALPSFTSSSLSTVDVSRNKLSGTLPTDIGENHALSLTVFDAMDNQISGTIPSSFSKMKNLGTLSLSSNRITGLIPPSLGSIPTLMYLYLDNNANLVGPIPPSLARPHSGQMDGSILSEIWLQENNLSGTLPAAMADLKKLVDFFVDGNKFTGKVPEDLCNEQLNSDFFENIPAGADRNLCDSVACPVNEVAFEGVYPCTKCDSLHYNPYLGRTGECIALNQRLILDTFYASTSKLGPWGGAGNWGDDEAFLCDFVGITCDGNNNVVEINLRARGLSGTIPEELGFLKYLEVLDVSGNDLTGFLPSDLRWAPLRRLDISGNRIKSIVPPMLCLMQGVNGNGLNGDYNCERIACPAGTFGPLGRKGSAAGEHCLPCADEDALYLGRKQCTTIGLRVDTSRQHGGLGVSGLTGTIVALVAVAIAGTFFIILRAHRKKYARRSALPQNEDGDEILFSESEKTVYNRTGVSSLPYSDDPDGASDSGRKGTWKDMADRISPKSYRDEEPRSERFLIGRVGNFDNDGYRDEGGDNESIDEDHSVSSALEKEVARQNDPGSSTKVKVWDYPDPLEDSNSVTSSSSAWNAEKDSNKEVWLDVPKI